MAGRMGNAISTLKNLVVIDVSGDDVFIKGLVPGGLNSLVIIKKIGESKKFTPLWREKTEESGSDQSLSEEKVDEQKEEKVEEKSLKAEEKSEQTTAQEEKAVSADLQSASDEPKKEESADAKAIADKENAS